MTHDDDDDDGLARAKPHRQVRLELHERDHRRLRVLAAEMNKTYSEVCALGLAALVRQGNAP
jgi:hypothetical protein